MNIVFGISDICPEWACYKWFIFGSHKMKALNDIIYFYTFICKPTSIVSRYFFIMRPSKVLINSGENFTTTSTGRSFLITYCKKLLYASTCIRDTPSRPGYSPFSRERWRCVYTFALVF